MVVEAHWAAREIHILQLFRRHTKQVIYIELAGTQSQLLHAVEHMINRFEVVTTVPQC